jgi:hypothetical protein
MAAIFLLSALMLAAPPALARPPSVPADVSWCAEGRNLSFAQRISGCSAILTRNVWSGRALQVVSPSWR